MAVKPTIAEALQDKIDSKAAIKAAIISKGVAVDDELLSDYAGKVNQIDAKSWANFVAVRNKTKTTIEDGDIDFSLIYGVATLAYLFIYCSNLTFVYLKIPNLDGTNALNRTFQFCSNLQSVSLDISNCKSNGIFNNTFDYTPIKIISIINIADALIYSSTVASNNIFANSTMPNVETLIFEKEIKPDLYLAIMTSLTFSSVIGILAKLFNYAGLTAHTITFNRNFTGLSQGDFDTISAAVSTANARNWTVAGLTYSM